MPDNVQIYGGPSSRMPRLSDRSPGYCTDTAELYIGTPSGNRRVGSEAAADGRFARVIIREQMAADSAENGTLFEDTDGALKYKNLKGNISVLGTADPPEPEPDPEG